MYKSKAIYIYIVLKGDRLDQGLISRTKMVVVEGASTSLRMRTAINATSESSRTETKRTLEVRLFC